MKKHTHWLKMELKTKLFLFVWVFAFGFSANAQTKKFVVYFKDKKSGNPFSITNPGQFLSQRSIQRRITQNLPLDSTDLPVKPAYLNGISNVGATVVYPLKWLNGAIVDCLPELIPTILALPYVVSSKALNSKIKESPVKNKSKDGIQSLDYGQSLSQNSLVGIDSMHSWGFHGEGKLISVLDGGFLNVNEHQAFAHMFANQKLLGTRDVVSRDGDVFSDHWHGASVLSNIGGFLPGSLVSGAYASSYYLIRTEEVATENEIECAYWAVGLELADSIGSDVVNSSLGYTTFDTQALDYSISIFDGRTTLASRTAGMAARKGMVVVCSAGNEGNNSSWGGWISAPADADSILTVGSVNNGQNYSSFSGKGPTIDGRVKPDLVAVGSGTITADVFSTSGVSANNGTSFSAPIIAGLVAGFWQAHPGLTAMQVINALKASGSNVTLPNNQIGWGLPNFIRAHVIAGSKPAIRFPLDLQIFPNPTSGNELFIELIDSYAVGNAAFEISDLRGAVALKGNLRFDLVNQKHSISLPTLAPGMYNVKLEMGGKQFLKRVILR